MPRLAAVAEKITLNEGLLGLLRGAFDSEGQLSAKYDFLFIVCIIEPPRSKADQFLDQRPPGPALRKHTFPAHGSSPIYDGISIRA